MQLEPARVDPQDGSMSIRADEFEDNSICLSTPTWPEHNSAFAVTANAWKSNKMHTINPTIVVNQKIIQSITCTAPLHLYCSLRQYSHEPTNKPSEINAAHQPPYAAGKPKARVTLIPFTRTTTAMRTKPTPVATTLRDASNDGATETAEDDAGKSESYSTFLEG